ncbi:MAG: septum formation initiator family protein [Clostridia bacterium]|nr:septum formation initiator family protein [Clostridia bacterium]
MTTGNNYALAEKMKNRFSGRGSAVDGMQASSTAELMRRAEREHNPRGNVAEQAFRENYSRHESGVRTQTARLNNRQNYRQTPRTASGYGTRTNPAQSAAKPGTSQRTRQKASPAPEPTIVRPEPITPAVEMQAEKKPFPKMFFVLLLLASVMIMTLVLGISDVYKTQNEIAALEKQLAELEETAEQLELRLDDKNDVKTIESMASQRLGMVKEEYVQKEYISLSDGERIELIETPEEETTGGVMLSSIFSALGDFFERFK